MSTQPQSLSKTTRSTPGGVPTLTPAQRETIERAVELIVAADGIRTLAEFLQVTPTIDEMYVTGFGRAVRLLDEVVGVVDDLIGVDGNAAINLAVDGDR